MPSQPSQTATSVHKWEFLPRFRSGSYGWKGSRLACQRLKEALTEIRAVARQNPTLAAEGAIRLLEKLWPAFQHVDSSSGALGSATYHAVESLADLISVAPADGKTRARWLERLWEAVEEDGVGYVQNLVDRWGDLCASPETAGEWADTFMQTVRRLWEDRTAGGYYNGTTACFSSLLAAGRNEELLELLEHAPHVWWEYRRFGVPALAAMGRVDDAIAYAQSSRGLNDSQAAIDAACERILLSEGRAEEAYGRYALTSNRAMTNLATYRAIQKKYPMKDPGGILRDLVATSPGEEGKWFATAKELKLFDLALELAGRSPCDPMTLNRAARDFVSKNPRFALGAALASLRWMARGYGYEITLEDAREACRYLLVAAETLGETEQARHAVGELLTTESVDLPLRNTIGRNFGF